jgi:L-malate glycosyltransferase
LSQTKIAYFIGCLGTGGAEHQLLELLRNLDRSRFSPSLVLFEDKTASRADGLVVGTHSLGIASTGKTRWRVPGLATTAAVLRLASYLRHHSPEILHAFLPAACALAVPAGKLARVPVVICTRLSLTNGYRTGGLRDGVDRLATRLCDFVVCNSTAATLEVVELDKVPSERVTTIYNGVDTLRFRPGDRRLRKQYGWNDNNIVFGVVANFIPYKRHTDFIRAAAIIAAQEPLARFVMAGEDHGPLNSIIEEIERYQLQDKFTVIRGTAEPERLYPALDVYICSSETEGLSNVLLEASACDLPIIATRAGGNPEVVRDGENGFLVDIYDYAAIAERGLTLIRNPDLRKCMGSRGREYTELHLSVSRMVQNHELLYDKLLAGPARPNLRHELER